MASERRAAFDAACTAVDRDADSMWTSVQAMIFITDTEQQAEQILAGPRGPMSLAGSAARLLDEIGSYTELGFDEFIVPDWNLGSTPAERRESLERIQTEIFAPLT